MRVVLAGASGLIGGLALKSLVARADIKTVTTITRTPINPVNDMHVPIVAPLAAWSDHVAKAAADIGICCLGTTIKAAGSREAFAAVDLSAVAAFAQACRNGGARHFIMVTSVGADPGARNFYLSTKGKAEAAIRDIGFARVDIMRPGLLVGQRRGPARLAERIAIIASPLTDILTPNVLSRYRSIPAHIVANAISACAGASERGVYIHHNEDMHATQSVSD